MGKVEDLDKFRPHVTHEVICVFCGERWQAVAPVNVPLLAYGCGCGRTGGVILTGQTFNEENEPEFF